LRWSDLRLDPQACIDRSELSVDQVGIDSVAVAAESAAHALVRTSLISVIASVRASSAPSACGNFVRPTHRSTSSILWAQRLVPFGGSLPVTVAKRPNTCVHEGSP